MTFGCLWRNKNTSTTHPKCCLLNKVNNSTFTWISKPTKIKGSTYLARENKICVLLLTDIILNVIYYGDVFSRFVSNFADTKKRLCQHQPRFVLSCTFHAIKEPILMNVLWHLRKIFYRMYKQATLVYTFPAISTLPGPGMATALSMLRYHPNILFSKQAKPGKPQ